MALGDERDERVREVEAAMARRIPRAQMEAALCKRWDCSSRQVRRYMAEVRKRWRDEAIEMEDDRPSRRDEMRASLNAIFAKAMAQTRVVKDANNNPVMDPTTGRPLVVETPDLRSAIQASRVLVQLDALDAPMRMDVTASVTHSASEADRAALEAFLTGRPATKT